MSPAPVSTIPFSGITGTGLPGRWSGCSDFTIVETDFGLGHNFLATWAAWRARRRNIRDVGATKGENVVAPVQ